MPSSPFDLESRAKELARTFVHAGDEPLMTQHDALQLAREAVEAAVAERSHHGDYTQGYNAGHAEGARGEWKSAATPPAPGASERALLDMLNETLPHIIMNSSLTSRIRAALAAQKGKQTP